MAGGRVTVEGVGRLSRALNAAGVELSDLKDALKRAADIVEETAATLAPQRDGALVATLRTSATKKAGIVRAGNKATPYAGPVHWGWPARGIKANPFIYKAAINREPQWLDMMARHIDQIIDETGD